MSSITSKHDTLMLSRLKLFRNVDLSNRALLALLDLCEYRQLIKGEVILSTEEENRYLYIITRGRLVIRLGEHKDIPLAIKSLYDISDTFTAEYLPYVVELTRAFVQPKYQPKYAGRKAAFSLDNIWDGLGALVIKYPFIRYFFGRLTFFSNYDPTVRDLTFYFFAKHLQGDQTLMQAEEPFALPTPAADLEKIIDGRSAEEDYKKLNQAAKNHGTALPPLVKSYFNVSGSLKVFEPVFDSYFGFSYAAAIMVTIADVYPAFIKRYITPYKRYLAEVKE